MSSNATSGRILFKNSRPTFIFSIFKKASVFNIPQNVFKIFRFVSNDALDLTIGFNGVCRLTQVVKKTSNRDMMITLNYLITREQTTVDC